MTSPNEGRILILAPFGRDGPLAQRILREAGLDAQSFLSFEDLCAAVDGGVGAILLVEEVLSSEGLRSLLTVLERQPPWSDIPVVVFGSSDASLAERANVTLLERPVRIRTLLSTVRAALRARNRQYQARNLLNELEQSVRDRDQFLAMLGHELRNPLAAILTSSELLDQQAGSAHAKLRAVIGRQVRHLARLVDDLLDVARITSGKIALEREELDLAEVVARTAQTYEAHASQRGLRLVVQKPAAPLRIEADVVRLEQIVGNILGNAVKYTPSGGSIEVETAREAGFAVLRVRDSGVGISPEILPRIFDLFVQAPGSLDRAQGGMGIGLTLVQRLVALHGGAVRAHSDGVGKGSEFEVRFPLAVARGAPRRQTGAPRTARGAVVMLAEDNVDSREMLQMALEGVGHRVHACGDGISAVNRALVERPGAMIVDLGLPLKDGYQVARDVRRALGKGVRLIALTGYGQPEDKLRALDAGFDEFLTKPVEIDDILRVLGNG